MKGNAFWSSDGKVRGTINSGNTAGTPCLRGEERNRQGGNGAGEIDQKYSCRARRLAQCQEKSAPPQGRSGQPVSNDPICWGYKRGEKKGRIKFPTLVPGGRDLNGPMGEIAKKREGTIAEKRRL